MDELILNVNTLPEPLHRRIRSKKVRVREVNGVIMLLPIDEINKQANAVERMRGMFAGMLSTEEYTAQKQLDKELEG